jgi:hypothetical protein
MEVLSIEALTYRQTGIFTFYSSLKAILAVDVIQDWKIT